MNHVVARYQDGRIIKGQTNDFLPTRMTFHIQPEDASPMDKPLELNLNELKALFFVRDLEGDPLHANSNAFDPEKPAQGRKVQVEFKDGEILVGVTQGYHPERPGFFVVPADAKSNNERCFVVTSAAKQVQMF